jgi:hypothetical protein
VTVTKERSNQLNYVPTRQINKMRNRQCSCGVVQIARSAPDDPDCLRAETANKRQSKSSSQNYPNSFSENAKAPAPKASDVREQFGERREALGEVPVSAIFRLPRCKSTCVLFYCTVFIAP